MYFVRPLQEIRISLLAGVFLQRQDFLKIKFTLIMRLFMFYDSIIDACRVDQNIVTQLRIRRVRLVIPQNLSV